MTMEQEKALVILLEYCRFRIKKTSIVQIINFYLLRQWETYEDALYTAINGGELRNHKHRDLGCCLRMAISTGFDG
jgi:hypothetical protein